MNSIIQNFKLYLEVIRFYRIYNFFTSAAIYLFLGIQKNVQITDVVFNSLIYIFVFGFLLYGGIYILNEIADIDEDRKIPYKAIRPITSGKISIKHGVLLSVTHIVVALIILYYLNSLYFIFGLLFLFVNLLYTFILKKLSRIISSLFITVTFILRLLLPIFALNAWDGNYLILTLIIYFFGSSLHLMLQRRMGTIDLKISTRLIKVTNFISIAIALFSCAFYRNTIFLIPHILVHIFLFFRAPVFLKSLYITPKNFIEQLEKRDV